MQPVKFIINGLGSEAVNMELSVYQTFFINQLPELQRQPVSEKLMSSSRKPLRLIV